MSKKIRKNPRRIPQKKNTKPMTRTQKILLITIPCVILLAIGLTVLLIVLHNRYNGWKIIPSIGEQGRYSSDIELTYLLGESDLNAKDELEAIQSLYTEKLSESERIFSTEKTYEGLINLKTITQSPNSIVCVSQLLYETLKTMTQNGNRMLFYAPISGIYSSILSSSTDEQAAENDPHRNHKIRTTIDRLLPYILSEEHIRIEFLEEEERLLTLYVSEEYMAELSYLEIDEIISLGVFECAFVVDHVADAFIKAGYTNGLVSSYNGYTRSLGIYGKTLQADVYQTNSDGSSFVIGEYSYTGAHSLVSYHNSPRTQRTQKDFYLYEDGKRVSPYFNLSTGLNDAVALEDMLFYTDDLSCAALALQTYSYFVNPSLLGKEINQLTDLGIYALYAIDGTIFYNEAILISDTYLTLSQSGFNKSYLFN